MTLRRRALLGVALFPLRADETDDALRTLEPLVAALSDGRSEPFMAALDPEMPGYTSLADSIEALVRQAEVSSSVKVLMAERERFEVDWIMSLRGRHDSARIERRRERVKISVARRKIRSIEPLSFFAPMRPAA